MAVSGTLIRPNQYFPSCVNTPSPRFNPSCRKQVREYLHVHVFLSVFCSCKWTPWSLVTCAVLKAKEDASHFSWLLWLILEFSVLIWGLVQEPCFADVFNDCFDSLWQFCLKASAGNTDGEERKLTRKEKDGGWKIEYTAEKPATPLLDTINYPAHMKNLSTQVDTGNKFRVSLLLPCFIPLCCYSYLIEPLFFRISNN